MNNQAYVKTEIIEKIGKITFFNPAGNSLPGFQLEKLKNAVDSLSENKNVKVILLQSEGNTFCAGASFNELISLQNMDEAVNFFMGFAQLINSMRKANKFIVTLVQGKAVGGGVGLIAASDFVMATDLAAVKLSELSLGIGPYVIAPAVKRKIGTAGFSEMSISANKWFTAFWAKEKSLFAEVYKDQKQMINEANILLKKLASYDEMATLLLKREIWEGTENWDEILKEKAQISASLVLRDFTQKKLKSFQKKRKK